ncbi:MAG TPA: amidohydrolase family protein [Burkholderiales bacterium]|nr:amidohydrolase family protein [Burkholderiales bacterium]
MQYRVISADCHIDLIWLPPDLFTRNASPAMKERMPYVTDGPDGPVWVTRSGASFGLMNGMGSAGRKYVPGQIHRSDRMAAQGLYEDGRKGIRRLTDPALRLKDQDRDGIQAEVLYGILGAGNRLNDPEAAIEMYQIYNSWLSEFCKHAPERLIGLASLTPFNLEAAVAEVRRAAKLGLKGLEFATSPDMVPLYDPIWEPLWQAVDEVRLPLHFHTTGGARRASTEHLPRRAQRAASACLITGFQLQTAQFLMAMIYGGVLERYPGIRIVLGESGIGWIPYILNRMDYEYEDQFHNDLELSMKPSEYWARQCRATFQVDEIGVELLHVLGEDTVMWGSDFPHPDGVWPDSQEYIARQFGHLSERVQNKLVCENAMAFYGLANA